MHRPWIVPALVGFVLGAAVVGAGILVVRFWSGSASVSEARPTLHLEVQGYAAFGLDAKETASVGSSAISDHQRFGSIMRLWTVHDLGRKELLAILAGTMTVPVDPQNREVTVLVLVEARKPIRLQLGDGLSDAKVTINDKEVPAGQLIDLGPSGQFHSQIVITGKRLR